MTITRADVADLRPGDVVELTVSPYVIRGPLDGHDSGALSVNIWRIRNSDGYPVDPGGDRTLTVISRAPRLYVNHDRTEPVPGDVVRDEDDSARSRVWIYLPHVDWPADAWMTQSGNEPICRGRDSMPARLRLLVDGETGNVVPS